MAEKIELKADLDRELLAVQVAKLENWATEMARSADAMHEIGLHEAARGNKQLSVDLRGAVRTIMTLNTRAQPTPQDQGSLPDGWPPERTAIARTIDPDIWAARDRAFSGDPHTPWDVVLHDSLLSASLATADAILALPRAHAEKG